MKLFFPNAIVYGLVLVAAATRGTMAAPPLKVYRDAAEFVLIISEPRSSSTEQAENIGDHPCGYSMNEYFASDKPKAPAFYDKYNSGKYVQILSKAHVPKHTTMLEKMTHLRQHVCDKVRPQEVKETCGGTCTLVFKIHGSFAKDRAEEFLEAVTYNKTRSIIVERDEESRKCSVQAAKHGSNYGHFPGQAGHNVTKCVSKDPDQPMTDANWHYVLARETLRQASRPALEVPFLFFVKENEAAKHMSLAFAGLSIPPLGWEEACGMPWCAKQFWPTVEEEGLD